MCTLCLDPSPHFKKLMFFIVKITPYAYPSDWRYLNMHLFWFIKCFVCFFLFFYIRVLRRKTSRLWFCWCETRTRSLVGSLVTAFTVFCDFEPDTWLHTKLYSCYCGGNRFRIALHYPNAFSVNTFSSYVLVCPVLTHTCQPLVTFHHTRLCLCLSR